jgi:hypothetical protein
MSESYIIQRVEEKNRRFEVLSQLHPLLHDLVIKFGVANPNEKDVLETPFVPLVFGWEVSLYRPDNDERLTCLKSGTKVCRPVEIFIIPSQPDYSSDIFDIPELSDDAQFWLVIGDNGALDRSTGEDLSATELISILDDVRLIIQPALEGQTQTN